MCAAGGKNNVYRIVVRPLAQPDFTLSLSEERQLVPTGGVTLLRVKANRVGYGGPIKLSLPGLPAGINVSGQEIPAGANEALVSLTTASGPVQSLISISGESNEPNVTIKRDLLVDENQISRRQPWLRTEVAVAVTTPGPVLAAWDGVSDGGKLTPSGSIAVQAKATRAAGAMGTIRFALITTQPLIKKTVKVNNQDQSVDDVDRMLRLEGMPVLAADQSEIPLKILIPADLPPLTYDLALKAELLSADGKTVVATAVTPARRLIAEATPKPAGQ